MDFNISNQRTGSAYSNEIEFAAEQQRFMTKVYGWMSLALGITGLVAFWTASNPTLINLIFGSQIVFFILIIAQLLIVGGLVGFINKISAQMATLIFILYSILTGLTLSVVFLVFTSESLAQTFFITAITFAIMSFYGYTTKTDLTKLGNILLMALIGIIIASIVNMFMQSEMLYWITSYIGVLIFVGLIAYDTQKIKNLNIIGNEGTEEDKKEAILGALTLYLDFINLFLFLLRIFGRKK